MTSVFSKIIKGDIPSYKVAESEDFFAFLDISPLAIGHTLVIPKQETDYIFDLDDQQYQALFLFAKRVAKAIGAVIECKKVGIAVVGLEVPHAHIHLVPLKTIFDIDFSKPKLKLSTEELGSIAGQISEAYKNL